MILGPFLGEVLLLGAGEGKGSLLGCVGEEVVVVVVAVVGGDC